MSAESFGKSRKKGMFWESPEQELDEKVTFLESQIIDQTAYLRVTTRESLTLTKANLSGAQMSSA